MAVAYVLFGALFTVAAAIAFGAILAARLRLRWTIPLAFVIGACPLSLLVTWLALAGLAHKGVFLALGGAAIAAATALRACSWLDRPRAPRWFWVGFAPFFVFYLCHAMAPEISPDGMAYHLGLVQLYAKAHRMMPVPDNMLASLSQGMEMLFLFAFTFGRHSAAALVHFAYLAALPLLIADFGARRGLALAGAFGGLFVFATPIAGIDGVSTYNDIALAAIWFSLFAILDDAGRQHAVPAGMLAGFAYGVKYTAFTAAIYLAWRLRRQPRHLAIAALAAAAFVLTWVIRNGIWLGNPFAPFLNAWFPNPHVSPLFETEYSAALRTYGIASAAEALRNILLHGEKTSGFLGPLWVLAPLGMTQWIWIAAAAAFPLNIGTRFLIPALPFLAYGIGRTLARWPVVALAVLAAHMALSWPAGQTLYRGEGGWFLEGFPWKAALRMEPEESYLQSRRGGEYTVARMIEDFVPAGEPVFSFSPLAQAYTARRITVSFYSAHGLRIRDVLLTPVLDYLWPMRLVTIRLEEPQERVRLLQQTTHASEPWTVSEITPPPRSIHPALWTGPLAFDGNPLTRWSTGTTLRPGALDLEFDRPVEQVVVRLTRDQWSSRFSISGAVAAVADDQETVPLANLRRWASETVRGWGYRYIVVSREDFAAADFAARAADWNLEPVAERGGKVLYRLR